MRNHFAWMLIGCGLPLSLIFLMPAFGVDDRLTLFTFIVLMFGCHLFMSHHRHATSGQEGNETNDPKGSA